MRRFVPVTGLVLLLTLVSAAQAQDDEQMALGSSTTGMDDAARASFVAGQQAYQQGEFEAALRAFSSGYQLSPRPAFLFNIGMTHARCTSSMTR